MFHRSSHKLLVYNTYLQVAVKAIRATSNIEEEVWTYLFVLWSNLF